MSYVLSSMQDFLSPKQSLAKLQERFHSGRNIGTSEPDLTSGSINSRLSLSTQTLDAGSQTSTSADVSYPSGRLGPSAILSGPELWMGGKWDRS